MEKNSQNGFDYEKCENCGTPKATLKELHWYSSGLIGQPELQGIPVVMLEVDHVNAVYNGIAKKIGYPTRRLIDETKSAFTHHFLAYRSTPKPAEATKEVFEGVRAALTNLCRNYAFGNLIDLKLEENGVTAIVDTPSCEAYFAGSAAGIIEYFGFFPGLIIDWERSAETLRVYLRAQSTEIDVKKHVGKPIPFSDILILKGEIEYDRCPECITPLEVSKNFRWDFPKGKFWQWSNGKQQCFLAMHCWVRMLEAVETFVGDTVPKLISEIEKDYFRKQYSSFAFLDTDEETYQNILHPRTIGIRGWGRICDVKKKSKELKVRVENAIYEPIVANMIGGAYEALEGHEAQVEWTPNNEGFTIITVAPK